MNSEDIKCLLEDMADKDFLKFHAALCPGCNNILGIRTPKLKELAKNLAKEKEILSYMEAPAFDYAEEIMLFGFILANLKLSDSERLAYLKNYISHITSWAVCDSPTAAFKFIQKNRSFYEPFIKSYLTSDNEYEVRFAVVALLDHYMTADYIDSVLNTMSAITHDAYYVKMAVAWTLSVCYIHFPEKTLPLLKAQTLDTFTHNKTIQKICESLRVTDNDKILLRTLKKC